jgi:glycosyltransferase involved in cell wall biosynthesis
MGLFLGNKMHVIQEDKNLPLITVGVVVLNREWIIEKMLDSLLRQTYPHSRIFVVIVDGKSKDKTVEVARKALEKSDFIGYNIIVRECTIPQGRNICIENMRGDMLLFWDSDIIMEPNAIQELVRTMVKEKADIATAGDGAYIYVNAVEEIDAKINEARTKRTHIPENCIVEVPVAGMGCTLISRNVLNSLRFDPDLTISEDMDFTIRAREKGFKIIANKHIVVFDINIRKREHSDIYIDMPLKNALKGLRKRAKVYVLASTLKPSLKETLNFFIKNKRYIFYLGYIPLALLTIYGIFLQNIYLLSFPIYLTLFAVWQVKRRGFIRGVKAVLRSILVGLPFSLMLIYYFCKYIKPKKWQQSH